MPSSNLAAYLAKNYLTASESPSHSGEPPKKKRKKSRHQSHSNGLVIDDDEDLSLSTSHNGANDEDELNAPMMFEGNVRSAEFRKAKKSAWQSIPDANPASTTTTNEIAADDNETDVLLRNVQSDEARRLAEQEAENAPTIVDTLPPAMESGIRAGLQTAADTAKLEAAQRALAASEAKEETRRRKSKKARSGNEEGDPPAEEETVYRDATGRRIDLSLRRAEARREEAERQQAQRQEKLDAMGDVQRREREDRRRELDEAKFLTLGRGVEDEDYNNQLKDQLRWDDPMAAYMADKKQDEDSATTTATGTRTAMGKVDGKGAKPRSTKKEYQGAAPPNRYGIKPGWRWDGVDRANGFEKEWFQARSRRSRNEQLSYEWQMDE